MGIRAPWTLPHPIVLEICPISNQVLQYVDDLRDHPATVLFSAGVPIVLSSDDPAALGYANVSNDWLLAFMAWDLDLAGLKRLALNSIVYSALSDSDKMLARDFFAA